jgi:hypothetical protein
MSGLPRPDVRTLSDLVTVCVPVYIGIVLRLAVIGPVFNTPTPPTRQHRREYHEQNRCDKAGDKEAAKEEEGGVH